MAEERIDIIISGENQASPAINDASDSLNNLGDSSQQAAKEQLELEKALKRLGTDFEEVETGISKFERATINSFNAVANNSQATSKQIEVSFERALKSVKSPEGISQLERDLEKLRQEGKLSESQLESLQKQLRQTGHDAQDAAGEVTPLSDSIREVAEAASEGEGPLGAIGGIINTLSNPAVAAGAAIAGLVAAYTDINLEYQNTISYLTAMTGSQEKATKAMDYARQVAEMLGTDVNETAKAWVAFDAGMRATGASAEQSKSFFETLSHSIVVTGGSIEDVKETTELFNTALTEGTVSGEDLQELMKERMPRAFEETAKAAGMTNEELGKFLESGASMNDLIPILETGMKKAFGDPSQIEGVSAATQRLKNSLTNLFTDETTGSMTIFANLIDGMAQGVDGFNRMIEEGQADVLQWISQIAAIKDYITGDIKSLDDLNTRLKQIDKDHTSDLKRVEDAHNKVAKASTDSGNAQTAAARKAALDNSELKKKISDLKDGYDRLAGSAGIVGSAMSEVGKKLDLSNPKSDVDKLTFAIKELETEFKFTQQQITEGLIPAFKNLSDSQLAKMLKEVNDRMADGQLSTQNFTLQAALLYEQQTRLSRSSIALAQSNKTLADAEAKTADVTQKNVVLNGVVKDNLEALIEVKKKQIDAITKGIALTIAERNEAQKQLDLDIKKAEGINAVSDSKRNEYKARQQTIDAKNQEIIQGLQIITGLSKEQKALEGSNNLTNQYIRALNELNKLKAERITNEGRVIELAEQQARAESNLAAAMGDTEKATRKQNEADDLHIAGLRNKIEQQKVSLEIQKNELTGTISAALADGEYTKAEQDLVKAKELALATSEQNIKVSAQEADNQETLIQKTRELKEAKEEEAKAAKKASDSAAESAANTKAASDLISGILGGWHNELAALDEGLAKTFDNWSAGLGPIGKSTGEFGDTLARVQKQIDQLESSGGLISPYGFIKYFNRIAYEALSLERTFITQADAASDLTQKLDDLADGTGDVSGNMSNLIRQAEGAKNGMTLLDQSRLDGLSAAIDRAKGKMEDLRRASEEALAAAQESLLEQQGDELGVLQIQHQQRVLELQNQINEAKSLGNQQAMSNYQQTLAIEDQIYEIKARDIKQSQSQVKDPYESTAKSAERATVAINELHSATKNVTTGLGDAVQAVNTLNQSTLSDLTGKMNTLATKNVNDLLTNLERAKRVAS